MSGILLDWSDRKHWSNRERPCRGCHNLTHMQDETGQPWHKVCHEALLDVPS